MNSTETPTSPESSAQEWLESSLRMRSEAKKLLQQARERLMLLLEHSRDQYVAGNLKQELWGIEKSLGHHGQYFSQAGQDRFVAEHLFPNLRCGVFLEIGCYDGWTGSNSYFFEKHRNWQGVVVEPSPSRAKVASLCRTCQLVQAAVSDCEGETDFLEVKAGYEQMSGLVQHYDAFKLTQVRRNPMHDERKIQVHQLTLNQLVERSGLGRIDFCSIDVEGAERQILSAADWQKLDVQVFAIENNSGTQAGGMGDLLIPKGYQLATVIGKDEIFVRNDT